ncbi:MAG: hypothetical protein SGJ02_02855 [bacterium]|nr:hypothetical protein [bacterium]
MRFKKIIIVLCLCFIYGCAPKIIIQPRLKTLISDSNTQDLSWYSCRFQFAWPDKEKDADLSSDLLLAHAVLKPVILNNNVDISLWRFHRRAVNDQVGHEFSFIFYSSKKGADSTFVEISQNKLLTQAVSEGLITNYTCGAPQVGDNSKLESLSDKHWDIVLQRNWPIYAMGASSLWLGLVSESFEDTKTEDPNINDLLLAYKKANQKVTKIWNVEASHALLHHLNAIFGYEPLTLRKMNF